jgi:hypothetical protein
MLRSRKKQEIHAAISLHSSSLINDTVEAHFQPFDDVRMKFNAISYNTNASLTSPVAIQNSDELDPRKILLLEENNSFPGEISRYVQETVEICVLDEECTFVKMTLQASQLLVQERTKPVRKPELSTPRSSYNLYERLLDDTIELWVMTKIMTTKSQPDLTLRVVPTIGGENPQGPDSPPVTPFPSQSKQLVFWQLLAALEERSAALSRNVVNELEHRLVQRQQVSQFETLLTAVILLNCVERLTGFYHSLDTSSAEISPEHDDNADKTVLTSNKETESDDLTCPAATLVAPTASAALASELWLQGERFAELLTTLLKMRGLPPSLPVTCLPCEEGVSESLQSPNGDEKSTLMSVSKWLEATKPYHSELIRARGTRISPNEQSAASWDLSFIAKMLIPDG